MVADGVKSRNMSNRMQISNFNSFSVQAASAKNSSLYFDKSGDGNVYALRKNFVIQSIINKPYVNLGYYMNVKSHTVFGYNRQQESCCCCMCCMATAIL